MLIKAFLGLLALISGIVIAGGSFALLIKIGVFTRLLEFTKTAKNIKLVENFIILGGICGNIMSVFFVRIPLGKAGLAFSGILFGMFIGWLYMSLAETLSVFPIVFRKLKIKYGIGCVIFSMGIGKMLGALLYFMKNFGN